MGNHTKKLWQRELGKLQRNEPASAPSPQKPTAPIFLSNSCLNIFRQVCSSLFGVCLHHAARQQRKLPWQWLQWVPELEVGAALISSTVSESSVQTLTSWASAARAWIKMICSYWHVRICQNGKEILVTVVLHKVSLTWLKQDRRRKSSEYSSKNIRSSNGAMHIPCLNQFSPI